LFATFLACEGGRMNEPGTAETLVGWSDGVFVRSAKRLTGLLAQRSGMAQARDEKWDFFAYFRLASGLEKPGRNLPL
jgi:hypothetical protein